jgi:NitT/TauT family transport system substrate-binding protein
MSTHRALRIPVALLAFFVAGAVFAACSSDDGSGSASADTRAGTQSSTDPVTLRLGYFPNVTHAPAIVGIRGGLLAKSLGRNVTLKPQAFNAGPDVVTAIFSDALDASYIGPGPSISAFQQSNGDGIRIVSGAAAGGAFLVVKQDITSAADLKGKKIASPQLGNTQDVALRAYLKANGLGATENGGNVQVTPIANADSLTAFENDQIDGAWVPEPWATRLIQEGGGHVLVDEKTLWPGGKFATTVLIVRTDFLNEHPDDVEKLVMANVKTVQWIAANPDQAKTLVNQAITTITSKGLKDTVINDAWKNLDFTYDPVASSVRKSADNAYALDLLQEQPDLANLFDLDILNRVLQKQGLAAVSG